ncbi:hypothetical protein [Atopococcus tabaci]|uniref:hypothetical protein n=1 Tax=Atopococcus tabaci TaxID=269774 RepID=UPI000401B7AB|nr:hypothetical protein [Atopococcus tabaci]
MIKRTFGAKKQILMDVSSYKTLSCLVDPTGALTDDMGRKYHPAGTPVGGADIFANENAVLTNTNTAETAASTVGLLLHDVVFDGINGTTDKANATLLYFGTVNEDRMDVEITQEVRDQLNGKIYFMNRP